MSRTPVFPVGEDGGIANAIECLSFSYSKHGVTTKSYSSGNSMCSIFLLRTS
jgi:hypothetical protein